jgi:hypothetical protein
VANNIKTSKAKKPSEHIVPTTVDILKEFQTGNPDPRAMAELIGAAGLVTPIMVLTMFFENDFENSASTFVKENPIYLFAIPIMLGTLAFISAFVIYQRQVWGKRLA